MPTRHAHHRPLASIVMIGAAAACLALLPLPLPWTATMAAAETPVSESGAALPAPLPAWTAHAPGAAATAAPLLRALPVRQGARVHTAARRTHARARRPRALRHAAQRLYARRNLEGG